MNSQTAVERICLAALEHPASERAAFVVEACQGDEALRHEVESLLAHAAPADQFLAQPALHADAALAGLSGLSIGQNVGAYRIVAKLGAGGMGEVYRGRDTRLGRDVAIKILPVVFATDPERLARFEREARLLASLNHPHIAAIYGIETGPEETGHQVRALVMELVEGVALSDRIARGPLPVTEALAIAQQIADALAAAHEQGIIHRDLKPANIRLRADGTVKVLDFGLAKALPASSALADIVSASPTRHVSEAGFILGTAAYMSPEQARGELVDQRTDIWAFGCVVYEMLTGRVAFDGRTATDTLAKVLEGHADLDALPATTPLAIRRLIRRCLERSVGNRLQHIGDARADIADVRAGDPLLTIAPASAGPSSRARAWAVAAVALALLAGAAVWYSARGPADVAPAATSVRFDVPRAQAPPRGPGSRIIALSPDGSQLVYVTESGMRMRALDGEDVLLPVVGHQPFFSPDGKWLAFFSDSGLQRMPAGGGPVETITPDVVGTERTFGASWAPDGTIVLSRGGSLWRVNASGGTTELVGAPDTQGDRYAWPEFLPDGHSVLFTILGRGGAADARIAMIDLTSHRQTTILRNGHAARYLPAGYVLYASGGRLQAVRFDSATGDSDGVPVRVEGVQILETTGGFNANFAVSRAGMLAYLPSGPERLRSMAWVDSFGREEPIAAEPKQYAYPRISPDGTRVALDVAGENRDIWVLEFARNSLARITFGPTEDLMPAWSRDGTRVYYGSDRDSRFEIWSVAADGSGAERKEFAGSDPSMPLSMVNPNELLVFTSGPGTRGGDIGVVTLTGKASMRTLLARDGVEANAQVSPDGRWITYQSLESRSMEIWVRPYPAVDGRRVHIGAGVQPLWGRAGSNELYYWSLDGKLKVVSVTLSPDLVIGATRDVPLREQYVSGVLVGAWSYQISPKDGRLLLLKPVPGSEALSPIKVILNWTERLKRLVPPT